MKTLFIFCICLIASASASDQPMVFFIDSWFEFVEDPRNFKDAENYCAFNNGHLTSFESQEVYNFILQILTNLNIGVRIGLHKSGEKGTWEWMDKTNYDNRISIEELPNSSDHVCVTMKTDGTLVGEGCESSRSFVCRYKQVPLDDCPKKGILGEMTTFSDSCFETVLLESLWKNWADAGKYCEGNGGHLGSILSPAVDKLISHLLTENGGWIGLRTRAIYDINRDTFWTNGRKVGYVNIANDFFRTINLDYCMFIGGGSPHWGSRACHGVLPFVCQYFPDVSVMAGR